MVYDNYVVYLSKTRYMCIKDSDIKIDNRIGNLIYNIYRNTLKNANITKLGAVKDSSIRSSILTGINDIKAFLLKPNLRTIYDEIWLHSLWK